MFNLTIYSTFSYTSCYKLIVLTAKINNDNHLVVYINLISLFYNF